jgi:hypothetical protein
MTGSLLLRSSDYDGDGRTDLAVWRPSEGNWLWGAKTLFTARDHPDLQAEPSVDAPRG